MPIFLVRVEASVYDNDQNFIVVADSSEEAIRIVEAEEEIITKDARIIAVEALNAWKTKASGWKETLPNGKGIYHEYSPHAGDPELGE